MSARIRLVLAALVAVLFAAGSAAAALGTPASRPAAGWYLALGDSLSQGYQPVPGRRGAGVDTDQGYPDVLSASLPGRPTLVKLGCPGETTTTMIRGGICRYAGAASQLDAAADFLRDHRGGVALVTLDIGINDVVRCEGRAPSSSASACLARGTAALHRNLPLVLSRIRADYPGPVVGLNYYGPYAVDASLGAAGRAKAQWSAQVTAELNGILAATYPRYRMPVADVASAFSPDDAATVCRLTWMCSGPPVGQNLHADAAGYRAMARAVEAALPPPAGPRHHR